MCQAAVPISLRFNLGEIQCLACQRLLCYVHLPKEVLLFHDNSAEDSSQWQRLEKAREFGELDSIAFAEAVFMIESISER